MADKPLEHTLFISYRSVEKELPLQLASDLMKHGHPVWMDRLQGIMPGDPWRKSIEQGVNRAAGFIACLSPNYLESTWCRRELQRSDSLHLPIFPILLSPVPDELWPMEIQDNQYADFQNWTDSKAYQTALELLLVGLNKNLSPGPPLVSPPLGPADPDRDDQEDLIERGINKATLLMKANSIASIEAEILCNKMEMLLKQYQAAANQSLITLDDALQVKLDMQQEYFKTEWQKLKNQLDALQ